MTATKTKEKARCKICGTGYDDAGDALNCMVRCKAKQDMETLPTLVQDMAWSAPQLEVMWKTVAQGTTVEEFAYFLNVAKSAGLNPFLREIYCWKHKGKITVMTGRDGYLILAKRDPTFKGLKSMEVCEKDSFKMKFDNGTMVVETHEITDFNDRGKIIGAWAIATFEGQSPITVFASAAEYLQTNKDVWTRNPSAMMRKVPESIALKLGAGISGLVTTEEIVVPDGVAVSGGIEVDAEFVEVEAPKTVDPPKVPTSDTIPGIPDGKKLVMLEFPDKLEDYNINDFEITVKQCNEKGTHFSVKDINVFTDTNGQYWSAAKGFSATHARVHVDILDAILKFGIDKVKELHPKVDFVPYKSAGGK